MPCPILQEPESQVKTSKDPFALVLRGLIGRTSKGGSLQMLGKVWVRFCSQMNVV